MSNVLVVGFGNMGRRHARVLVQLGHDVRTLDPRIDSRADYSVPSVDLINWTDTVCVATPIDLLAQTAETWLRRGKHVLVEKPGATDLDTLAYLHQLAEEQGVRLKVGYTERHNPAVAALICDMPRVGRLRHISIRRLGYADSAVDPALNLACHDLDVLDALGFTAEIEHVDQRGGHVSALLEAQHVTAFDADTISVSLEASHLHPFKVRTLEVVGTAGVLRLDYQRQSLDFVGQDGAQPIHVDHAEPLRREWEAFMRNEGSNGMQALALAEQLVEAEAPVRLAA